MRHLRRVVSSGIELRFWVASCVTALSAFAQRALTFRPDGHVLATVFFATLALYNLDGSLDASRRRQPEIRRRLHLWLSAGSMLVCTALAWELTPAARIVFFLGLLLCGSYAIPLGRTGRSLKRVAGIKAPFVGTSVACATVLLPHLESERPADLGSVLWLIAVLSLCCSVNALLFDLPDLDEDAASGVPSLPRLLGISRLRKCALGALLIGLFLTLFPTTRIPPAVQTGLLVLEAALCAGTYLVTPATKKAMVALAIDGALILPLAVMTLRA